MSDPLAGEPTGRRHYSFPDLVHQSMERADARKARPRVWPADFPLPSGSVVVASDKVGNASLILRGDAESNVDQWRAVLTAQGYRLGNAVNSKPETEAQSSLRYYVRFPAARADFAVEIHVWEPAATGLAEAAVEARPTGSRPKRRTTLVPAIPSNMRKPDRDPIWPLFALMPFFLFAAAMKATDVGLSWITGILLFLGYIILLVALGAVGNLVASRRRR